MNDFYDKLDELYSAGDLAAVEGFILDAIEETAAGSTERAGLYNELAAFYRGVSRYNESEDKFARSLDIFEAAGMGASPEYATVLLNLAGLYRMRGEPGKAVVLFKNAMKRLEDAGAGDSYAYVSVLNNLALAYRERDEPELALEYAVRALDLIRAGAGGDHEIAASLNNLATIQFKLGDMDAADEYISEALSVYDAMPETDVHHAAAITTKAAIMCRAGEYDGALEEFRRSLELTRRFFGENIEFATCKRNIADVYELLDDRRSAITELSDAVRIMIKILGEGHPTVINMQDRLDQMKILDSESGFQN